MTNPPLESKIRDDIKAYLKSEGWTVVVTHGNQWQAGVPDILAYSQWVGHRWIDVKRPKRNTLTKAQRALWPVWHKSGLGVWIMEAADEENFMRLLRPPNWLDYWKKSYGDPFVIVQDLMEKMNAKAE